MNKGTSLVNGYVSLGKHATDHGNSKIATIN
jgi:hypothetical protein